MNRRDEVLREKILGYCREIEEAHRLFHEDKALFCDRENGAVYRNAVSMPLLQIGELAKNLSVEFRAEHSEIPWRDAMRMRDLFAHHYGSVDFEQTWDTSHSSIAELKLCFQMAEK